MDSKEIASSPTRDLIAKILLLSMSLFASLATIELILRVLAFGAPDVLPIDYVADPALQSLPKIEGMVALQTPNQRATFKGHYYRTNSDGIRGPEYRIPKPASTFRTIVVGDSFTMGSGVDEDSTYSAQLEKRLNTADDTRKHEVINMGIGGYNLAASLYRLRTYGLKYEPDLIVYGWTYNDIEDTSYRRTSNPPGEPFTSLLLEIWLRERFNGLRDMIAPAPDSYVGELELNYFHNDAAWGNFIGGLDALAEIVEEEDVCGVVLLHTGLYSLHAYHPFTRFYDLVAQAASERGLYVATSFDRHKGLSPEPLWIHPSDSHPNAEGHRILADALYDRISTLPAECLQGRSPLEESRVKPGDLTTTVLAPQAMQPGYTLLAHVEGDALFWVDAGGDPVREFVLSWPVGYVEQLSSERLLNLSRGRLQEIDGTGKVLWEYKVPGALVHHDVIPSGNGTYYTLVQKVHPELDLWYDEIHEVSPEDGVVWTWNSLDHLDPSEPTGCELPHDWSGKTDWLHANSLDLYPNGDLLVSLRNLNKIVRVSRKTGRITWSWGEGILGHAHSVKFLDNGNITIFDNGYHRQRGKHCDPKCSSRAIEIDPKSGEIVWEYHDEKLFSQGFGDVDRLANGNTLITYGQRHPNATIIEVSPSGEVVWRLDSKIATEALGLKRAMFYRGQRVDTLPALRP